MHWLKIILQIAVLLFLFSSVNRALDKRRPYAERSYYMARACLYLIFLIWFLEHP